MQRDTVKYRLLNVGFTWDDQKHGINIRKHGVRFFWAAEVFFDPMALDKPDDRFEEDRWLILGHPLNDTANLLAVVYTLRRDERGDEIVRIISARRAVREEREEYERH